jgi:glycosyltransferase involved in cell wall biosynthesis
VNVLFLDQFTEIGGAQRVLLDTLDAAGELGWGAHVALPGDGPLAEKLRNRNIAVTRIPCGPYQSGKKSARDLLRFVLDLPLQTRAIADLDKRIGFDLLYVNGPRLLPAAALSGCAPALFHAHSDIPQRRALKLAQWSIRSMGATVAACGNSVASALRDCVSPDRLHVIPNGVRELKFRQRDFRPDGNWRIGMLGRISPEKGQAEFLQAVKLVVPRLANARFLIFGAPLFGATEYFETVRELARDLPIEFRGWQEDLDAVFDDLDLLVVPSLREGMGRVVIEAFSAGVPVLAFPTGGIPEIIADGETGFLTHQRSPAALAARLAEIIDGDPEDRRRVAAQARCAWERAYRVDIYQKRITDLMLNVVSARSPVRETAGPPPRK